MTEAMNRMNARNNAFPKGQTWHFECEKWSVQAPFGIHLNMVALMPEIGPEAVLILREKRGFMSDLKEHGPFTLNIKSGAVRTSAGPIIFMLWWFPPSVGGVPYAAYELLIPPAPPRALAELMENAGRQSHMHLLILDENNEVFDVVEFENVYGLGRLLDAACDIGANLDGYDFEQAQHAFFREFSMEQIMAL